MPNTKTAISKQIRTLIGKSVLEIFEKFLKNLDFNFFFYLKKKIFKKMECLRYTRP